MADARMAKASGAPAQYFELLVARELADHVGVPFEHQDELNRSRDDAGADRVKFQEDNLDRLRPHLLPWADERVSNRGAVERVQWVGRDPKVRVERDPTDVRLLHSSRASKLSLKSTRAGRGTDRNPGGRDIASRLGFPDVHPLREEMYDLVRRYLAQEAGAPSGSKKLAVGRIKRFLTRGENARHRKAVAELVAPIQRRLAEGCAAAFNAMTRDEQRDVMGYLLATDPDLWLGEVSEVVAKIVPAAAVDEDDVLDAVPDGLAYVIRRNGQVILRLQANCTNGLGMSALCLRVFGQPALWAEGG